MKTTGLNFKAFYDDSSVWKDGFFHDDGQILVNGKDHIDHEIDLTVIEDSDVVDFEGVDIFDGSGNLVMSMADAFKSWSDASVSSALLVKVPADSIEALRSYVQSLGGSVVA